MYIDLINVLEHVNENIYQTVSSDKISAEMTVLITAALKFNDLVIKGVTKEIKVKIPRKRIELETLSFLSWYMPEELGYLVRLQILEEIKFKYEFVQARLICTDKINMKFYFTNIVRDKGTQHLFGNTLDKKLLLSVLHSLRIIIFNPRKLPPIPEQRRIGVGYKDKGHLPDNSRRTEKYDISFTQLQNEIELNNDTNETIFFLAEENNS